MIPDYPDMLDESRGLIYLINQEIDKLEKRIADLEFTLTEYMNVKREKSFINQELGFR